MSHPIALVTGGAGFIGSHMVDLLLRQGFRVHVIDNLSGGHKKNLQQHNFNPLFSFENIDINKLTPTHNYFNNVKFVFHFAGMGDIVPSIEKPINYLETNVQGTVRVLECARAMGVKKFIYAASSSCYGLASVPTREDHPVAPQYPYALSKYLGEQVVLHWYHVYGLPVNSIRIFNAYGPRVRTTGAYGAVFGVFLKQKLLNFPLTVVGNGSQRRDFLYVTDVAKAFLLAAETPKNGQIWNIGAGAPESINTLAKLIGGEVQYIPERPGEPNCTWSDNTKIYNDLGWQPEVSLNDGVKQMICKMSDWEDAPLWDSGSIAKATETWFKYLSSNY